MKTRELANLGVPRGDVMQTATRLIQSATRAGLGRKEIRKIVKALVGRPTDYLEHDHFAELAAALQGRRQAQASFRPRAEPAPYRRWGDQIEEEPIRQMENACQLPISVRGALMPDAHVGYGLPIGGVLATRGAVIPYAVGVDIACRMKMSVLDLPLEALERQTDRLKEALTAETRFGIGCHFKKNRREHHVLDQDWEVSPVTRKLKDKAWSQLGTSGSGNHFVEYGVLTVTETDVGIKPGTYLALLSHSGSRGVGATVCDHYSRLAMKQHPELPDDLRQLAWLSLDSDEGREYWGAMELMGEYASANHALIHRHIAKHLGVKVLFDLENHHNFAWKEEHDGEELIVHRKGATPAAAGDRGIIPGSMADVTFIVRGKGHPESLNSAAHGAGRVMSRKKAKETFTWAEANKRLEAAGVTLLSAGLDEVPMVYKNIERVMAAQSDLVEPLARFAPKLVKMAPGGRAED